MQYIYKREWLVLVVLEFKYFLVAQTHYNPVKDLKIHVSNMIVIWRWNEKKSWFVGFGENREKHLPVRIWDEIPWKIVILLF